MAENIVTKVQEQMGFAPFEKIDPNKTLGKIDLWQHKTANHFIQAAAITVLVGIFEKGSKATGIPALMNAAKTGNILSVIFGNQKNEVLQSVAHYGDQTMETTSDTMSEIASTAISLIQTSVNKNANDDQVAAYIAGQRHNILVYLPPELQLSHILNDNTIDDETNKMEGPVSTMVHFFEDLMQYNL